MNAAGLLTIAWLLAAGPMAAVGAEPLQERRGTTLYVSKLGDDTDGSSWAKAFRTIQGALDAIPDGLGGHTIIVRPDTYVEANLYAAHKGAKSSYNTLIGDAEGLFGGGVKGRPVIDSGDPEKGFKSYDWWSSFRATSRGWSKDHTEPTFSAVGWDRWVFRNLYVTGGDAGIFFDCTDKVEPFSVVVEDCVAVGRAFGGGVASCLSRPEEPITFRRCHLWSLDVWGDASAAYVRVENPTMPEHPDAVFEDCRLVGPQCSLKASNYGFTTRSRVALKRCRLITLNFSQPGGTPTDGIVQSVEQGDCLAVDFEDCVLAGYKVFGVKVKKETEKDIRYTTKGSCLAYVQFQQEVPSGFHRIGNWPVDAFDELFPPRPRSGHAGLVKDNTVIRRDMCEVAPVVWKGRLHHLFSARPASGGTREDYWLSLVDAGSGHEVARFATGHSLASAYVRDGVFYAFASRFENQNWNDVTMFKSSDLKNWESRVVIAQEPAEHLFNSSVAGCPSGFIMAYETNDPKWPPFTIKFARSKELETWEKVPDAALGRDRYAACPALRFADGHYYVLYLEHREPRWFFQTYVARSRDLKNWESSAANPVLTPDAIDDGINASDPDLVEFGGKAFLYYAVGDQLSWMNIKRALYDGPVDEFLKSCFPTPGIPCR